jgi:gentisate 1,2-dioxygenase
MEARSRSDLERFARTLGGLSARPLWERAERTGQTSAVPAIWHYADMRPQLLRAIDLITAQEAERRVLMLENPGLPGTGLIANSLFCGLQAISPGETAPAHRHSPNALRLIIESDGAYTNVGGERIAMHRGDLVLTPGWAWHGHGHLGSKPAIWLDALDLAFGHLFGKIFRENGPAEAQPISFEAEGSAAARYGANLLPVEHHPQLNHSPLLAYPYERTREALARLVRHGPVHPAHGIKMRYANPIDGGFIYRTIATFIQWLPEGFRGRPYRSTESVVFYVIEGSGTIQAGHENFAFAQDDVFVVPPWTKYSLECANECVLFSYSDRAAQAALGFWREDD